MNRWTRGAAAAIAITLCVAAVQGRPGARETGGQPLAHQSGTERIDFLSHGFAAGARSDAGRAPRSEAVPGWPGGVPQVRDSLPAPGCGPGAPPTRAACP